MNLVVCVKLVRDPKDLVINDDRSISLDKAEWTIGEYDLNALEAGVKLVETAGGKVIVLSAGPSQINHPKLKKDLLSRGPDELVLVVDDQMQDAETAATANVLALAIQKIGAVDLVLCGEGSADLYFQQVGLQLGEILCWPTTNAVSKIGLEEGKLLVERSLENEIEVLDVPLPAVLSLTTDINQPRLPTMREILKATKKPVAEWTLGDLNTPGLAERSSKVLSTKAPPQAARKQIRIPGSPEEAAQALLEYLHQETVL